MKHPERLQRAVRWTLYGGRLLPPLFKLRKAIRSRRTAPAAPAAPERVYRRFFTRDRSFEQLTRPRKK